MTVFGEGGGVIFDGAAADFGDFRCLANLYAAAFAAQFLGSAPIVRAVRRAECARVRLPFRVRFFLLSERSTAGSGNRSGVARRREIRQDTDFTLPDLPVRQMLQAVNHCSACGSVKELPVFQEIASASIDYVAGRIAVKINGYSLS